MSERKVVYALLFYCIFSLMYCPVLGAVTNKESLNINESVSENQVNGQKIVATELDLGDYQDRMKVGEKQLLVVTVLPIDATEQTISYRSSNEKIATVNGMGRIEAISVGECSIVVKCGKISEKIKLIVEPDDSMVADIEISDYESELEVDEIMVISAKVVPAEANDATIEFFSDNPQVATVNSSGEVKGISPGQVHIIIKAGEVRKSIAIVIKVATTEICLNSTYVVLNRGEEFQLKTTVLPTGAQQSVSYKSVNIEVAEISETGLILAKSAGSTTIVVSNGDLSNAVTVIVNEKKSGETVDDNQAPNVRIKQQLDTGLIEQINLNSKVIVSGIQYPILSPKVLKALYLSGHTLMVDCKDYYIQIDGDSILNYENDLSTDLKVVYKRGETEFQVNGNKNLPGKIKIVFSNIDFSYVYLFNQAKGKYQILNGNQGEVLVDVPGTYKLTSKKVYSYSIPTWLVAITTMVTIIFLSGYVIVKKRYWFW